MSYYNHPNPLMYDVQNGGVTALPTAKVEISVSFSNLNDKDVGSRSDPFCVLFTRRVDQKEWHETGRTEVLKDTLNSEWERKFIIEYHFETKQDLRFSIYDHDGKKENLSQHDFLGSMECTLGEVVAAPGGKLNGKLENTAKKTKATLLIRAEEMGSSKEDVRIQLREKGLDKKDFLGKSDPYIKISKMNKDGSYTLVYRSEVIPNTLDPVWQPMDIPLVNVCNGDYGRELRFDCYDDDNDGSDGDLIGSFVTDLRKLMNKQKEYELINEKKAKKKKKYRHSGILLVQEIKVEKRATFMDYLQAGTQMNFTVAVDFTASNGLPHDPSSLHYRSPNGWNQYTTAIRAVGDIVQDYDTDKMFPALGFGAKIPPRGEVSHEFALNFNTHNPYCAGIDGIIRAYYNSIQTVQLWGPTNFAPVIHHVSRFASKCQDGNYYFVLLIITDGVISDMAETKAALVVASSLPMSVIIIGVGDADFSAMDELDSDDKKIKSHAGVSKRDIVQFVPLKKFLHGGDWYSCQKKLAEAVLAEVPTQLLQYMKSKNFKPKINQVHSGGSPYPTSEFNKMSIHEPLHQAKICQKEHATPSSYQSIAPPSSQTNASHLSESSSPYPYQGAGLYSSQSNVLYPSQDSAPYPSLNTAPFSSQSNTSYLNESSCPYLNQGAVLYSSQSNVPYPGQGSTPYPSESSSPHSNQSAGSYSSQSYDLHSRQGSSPYPSESSSPHSNQSAGSYSSQSYDPHSRQGSPPYPSESSSPHSNQSAGLYPNQKNVAYPSQGNVPYPTQGASSYSSNGSFWSDKQGNAPYPNQGSSLSQRSPPYPSQSNTPYPIQNGALYPNQGSSLFQRYQSNTPYPTQNGAPYPNQGSLLSQRGPPYPSQSNNPYPI